jgi:PhnB protein
MKTTLDPYLSFRDNTRTAMEFYQSVFGGKLVLNTYKEFNASQAPSEDDKIMHAMLETENDLHFMAADTPLGMEYNPGTHMSLTLSGDDHAELSGYFEKLSEGGVVEQPLTMAGWGDTFGMLTDQFGIHWMVNIAGKHE